MKTVIVYDHPYEGSFCNAILKSVEKSEAKKGNEVDIIDLHQDKFNPVMSSQDLLGFVKHEMQDKQAIDYVNRIKEADKLVLIFPIWWELMPAMTKGFIDKVIFPGSTYTYTKSGHGMNTLLLDLKSVTVITAMNTPKPMYKLIYGNAIYKALVKGTFKKSGIKNVKWKSYNMVKMSSDGKRSKWLEQLENNNI